MGSGPELAKLYYRIGEVAHIVGVQPHVLRYWESEFRTIRPRKSSKGQRVYSRRDVEKLLRVKDLLKNQGFTIAGAKKRLRDEVSAGAQSAAASQSAPQAQVEARAAPEPAAERPPPAPAQPMAEVRKALVSLREDLTRMLDELGD